MAFDRWIKIEIWRLWEFSRTLKISLITKKQAKKVSSLKLRRIILHRFLTSNLIEAFIKYSFFFDQSKKRNQCDYEWKSDENERIDKISSRRVTIFLEFSIELCEQWFIVSLQLLFPHERVSKASKLEKFSNIRLRFFPVFKAFCFLRPTDWTH